MVGQSIVHIKCLVYEMFDVLISTRCCVLEFSIRVAWTHTMYARLGVLTAGEYVEVLEEDSIQNRLCREKEESLQLRASYLNYLYIKFKGWLADEKIFGGDLHVVVNSTEQQETHETNRCAAVFLSDQSVANLTRKLVTLALFQNIWLTQIGNQ